MLFKFEFSQTLQLRLFLGTAIITVGSTWKIEKVDRTVGLRNLNNSMIFGLKKWHQHDMDYDEKQNHGQCF